MSDATFYGRLALGGLIIAWMQGGPIAHQVFGAKVRPGMNTWRMYYGAARDVCDVRYYAVDASGDRRFVDRFEALGYDHFWDANRKIRRINDRAGIDRQGRQICREYLPRGQHLEAEARCASYKGWKPETFQEPICRGSAGSKRRGDGGSPRPRAKGKVKEGSR